MFAPSGGSTSTMTTASPAMLVSALMPPTVILIVISKVEGERFLLPGPTSQLSPEKALHQTLDRAAHGTRS